jgi:hypothetical protein
MNTTVHEWFWHKLNYFLFCQIFEKIIITCAEIFIIIIKLRICLDTLKLSHKHNKNVFIIIYKHYLQKNSELKNQVSKVRFKI